MKKIFYSTFLLFLTVAFTTSCQKEIEPIVNQSISSKLSTDDDFAKMLQSTGNLFSNFSNLESLSGDEVGLISSIIGKGDDATMKEKQMVAEILGGPVGSFTIELRSFTEAIVQLEEKYELSKLQKAGELESTITKALELNPELKQNFAAVAINGKGSDGANLCRGIVSLVSLLGGGALCTAIGVTTIPVVGGVLCTVVTTLATGILNALCDLIP